MSASWWRPQTLLKSFQAQISSDYSLLKPEDDEVYNTEEPLTSEKGTRLSHLSRLFWILLPSYVARHYGQSDIQYPERNETSYLNGLRGWAATIVIIHHATGTWYHFVENAYGSSADNYSFLQLPFIRLLFSRRFAVPIFFVLSGFVLSYSFFRKIYAEDSSGAIASLPAAVVRRPFRLFLPGLPIMLITACTQTMGIYYRDTARNIWSSQGFFYDQLAALYGWIKIVWRPLLLQRITPKYGPQMWTLPVELRGSLVIFMVTLICARLKPWLRMAIVTALAVDAFVHQHQWDIGLFLVGFLLADIRHFRSKLPQLPPVVQHAITVTSYLILVLALFLGGWANGSEHALGYSFFGSWPTFGLKRHDFFFSFSGVILLVALENLPAVQWLLNAPLSLYLGEISFAIYLVHWVFVYSVGKHTILLLRDQGYGGIFSWFVVTALEFVFTFWIGDVYWRLVDKKSVKFGRWVAEKTGA